MLLTTPQTGMSPRKVRLRLFNIHDQINLIVMHSSDFCEEHLCSFLLLSGAGYEWEDDFPLLPLATSSELSDSPPPPRTVPKAPDPKPAAHFSRFTVSPSSTSRFSITHISDSDMDSAGGGW